MPSLVSRLIHRDAQAPPLEPPPPTLVSFFLPHANPHSLPGNPAPHRGITPIEYMYDFNTDRFNPDGPYFVRGFVDTNTHLHNLALLALSKTTQVL